MQIPFVQWSISLSDIAVITTVLIAGWTDWTNWRIPNALVAGSAAAAVMIAIFSPDGAGLGQCLIGGLIGLSVFMPFYFLKGMAAGDVKLMGAIGAYVGAHLVLEVALLSALIGGIWAMALIDLQRGIGPVSWVRLHYRAKARSQSQAGQTEPVNPAITEERENKIPYGVVIAAGTLATLALAR